MQRQSLGKEENSSRHQATPAPTTSQAADETTGAPPSQPPSTVPVIGRLSEECTILPQFRGNQIQTKAKVTAGLALPLTPRSIPQLGVSPRTLRDAGSGGEVPECDYSPTQRETPAKDKLAFAALLFTVLCINSTFSLMAPFFPTEAERRGLVPVVTGAVFSIYSFCNFFASPILGALMQRRYIKRRTMLFLGLIISTAASAGFGVSVYIPDAYPATFAIACLALRTLNGIGAAAVDTSSMAMVTQMFRHSAYFGTLLGVLESSLAVGWMVGPLVGGYLATWGGFRAPFLAAAVMGLLLIPIPFAIPDKQRYSDPVTHGGSTVTPWQLLRQLDIALFMLVTVLSAAAITFLDATLAPFLQDTEGFSASTIGLCFAVVAASYAVSTTLAGWLSDKTTPVAVILTGQLLCVIPFALIGPSPLLQPLLKAWGLMGTWLIWVSLVLLGSGCAFGLMPVLPAVLTTAARPELNLMHSGLEDLVSGLVGGAYYLGGGAGPVVGGAATALLGFPWASTAYGCGLLLFSVLLMGTLFFTNMQRRRRDELEARLLEEDLA